jgi:gag-polypeptide of LTR copia-type
MNINCVSKRNSQGMPFEYKSGLEHCQNAAQLFDSLKQQYGSTTREGEFRLETQLMFMRKLPTDSLDDHITTFKTLIAQVRAHNL